MSDPTLQELSQQIKALEDLRYAKSCALTLQHLHDIKNTLDIKGAVIANGYSLEIPLPEYGQHEVLILTAESYPHHQGEEPSYVLEGPGVTTQYVSDVYEGLESLVGRAEHKVREAREALVEAEDLLKAYTTLRDHARVKFNIPEPIEALLAE